MSKLIEMDLGKDGIEYVQDCLRQGTGLCRKSLRLPLRSGQALAIVPPDTSPERAKSFAAGGLLRWGDSIEWLASHMGALWRADPEGTLILQDVWGARPGEAQRWPDAFYDDNAVYYLVHASAPKIEKVERQISSFLLVGFFAYALLPQANAASERRLDKATMENIADNTAEIFVSAYDREGFVMWRRLGQKKKVAERMPSAA